ncbi:MAG: hypothetical protein MZV70_54445 [Desulfobacterales bacterium]|nr:hypothetical protein [Desulfobacterales bacterium]
MPPMSGRSWPPTSDPNMKMSKKDQDEALAEWRDVGIGPKWTPAWLSLSSIGDHSLIAKDRIEAIKGITKMLGTLSTRPADAAKPTTDVAWPPCV